MHIVLFGATGNIGQRITAEALRRGHRVTGVVRDAGAVTSPDPRVTLVRGDATDAASVAAVARGADAIVSA
ncbi:MAG: dTDP-4-dehydrorhamnose reductase, partial [Gemmatimonadetes bacterium]|nr:dTDP-4-dehydrorhamnose reductase [Gemmatimonadota bacterium]